MSTVLTIIFTLNIIVVMYLLWRLGVMQRELTILRNRTKALDPELAGPPPQLEELFKETSASIIGIEILNAMELARKESWFAGVFGSVSPKLVRRKVYDQAANIIKTQLLDFGVEADVRVYRGN